MDTDRHGLKNILSPWLGTPYRHATGLAGAGADCLQFVLRVLWESGRIPALPVTPEYPADWHKHQDDGRLLKGLLELLPAYELIARPQDGDLFLFKFGRSVSHVAIFSRGYIWHAVRGIGVVATPWPTVPWSSRLRHQLRIKDEG